MPTSSTTAAEVKEVIDTDLTVSALFQFVGDANSAVDEILGSDGLTEARMTRIAKYLAAHLITLRDRRASRVKAGPVTEEYDDTDYLSIAASFDPTGKIGREFGLKDSVRTRASFKASVA